MLFFFCVERFFFLLDKEKAKNETGAQLGRGRALLCAPSIDEMEQHQWMAPIDRKLNKKKRINEDKKNVKGRTKNRYISIENAKEQKNRVCVNPAAGRSRVAQKKNPITKPD